jgi:flagellar motor switch/type III secretory pathway protein FliN
MNQTPDHAAILNGTSKNGEHRMEFDTLNEGAGEGADVRLDMILDVPVTLAMEVGRTRISRWTCLSTARSWRMAKWW